MLQVSSFAYLEEEATFQARGANHCKDQISSVVIPFWYS